jgi:hypothetical protein
MSEYRIDQDSMVDFLVGLLNTVRDVGGGE